MQFVLKYSVNISLTYICFSKNRRFEDLRVLCSLKMSLDPVLKTYKMYLFGNFEFMPEIRNRFCLFNGRHSVIKLNCAARHESGARHTQVLIDL